MALNKSSKCTPNSRSGYFSDLAASAGKQGNIFLPVRIKVTPNHTFGPLSCEKKNPGKMLQPVLIKDLLQSNKKDKCNTTITSASTQKKKSRSERSTQPYLNTQSCRKPQVEEAEDSLFFPRMSYAGAKVRRQLYQMMDSPKQTVESKENTAKQVQNNNKPAHKTEIMRKSTANQNKGKNSSLLPPNSIKNNYLRNSGSNFKVPGKQSIKDNTKNKNRTTKNISRFSEAKPKKIDAAKNNIILTTEDDIGLDCEIKALEDDQKSITTRDNFTMTSPSIFRVPSINLKFDKIERPSVIVNTISKLEPPCTEINNLSISSSNCDCKKTIPQQNFDFSKLTNLDSNAAKQLKIYLQSSIQACEDQASKLKESLEMCEKQASSLRQILQLVMNICDGSSNADENKLDIEHQNTINSSANETDKLIASESSVENSMHIDNVTSIVPNNIELKTESDSKFQMPMKILITDEDLNQDAKEPSPIDNLNDIARLSTIGEVSCEVDDSNKDDTENKENISVNDSTTTKTFAPLTPKTPRNQILIYQDSPRRSARIAAKRLSSYGDDSDSKQDSFTLLENELNVYLPSKASSKSLPASPTMKPPATPGATRTWDKRVERPLKEYMALKMNGTFLVTPDVKRFQSALELSDTPQNSRKSLSRKIFMELCDLYADSPEPKDKN